MRIVYTVINFILLAGLIFLFGRKLIVSIFRERRLRIAREWEEANDPAPVLLPEVPEEPIADDEPDPTEEVRRETEEKLRQVREYTRLECRELQVAKLRRERRALLTLFEQTVRDKYRAAGLTEEEQRHNAVRMEEILARIALTPGDMAYLKHHDVLYVTLTSASPLPEALVRRAEAAATALLDTVGGKISYRVTEDPALIGGFRLRIGDTVYDATVSEQIYRLADVLRKDQLTEEDSADTILAALDAQIDAADHVLSVYQLGRVISVSDGICWMDGLADIMYGEVVEFDCGEYGMVLDIQKDRIGCVIFGSYEHIESYSKVRRIGRIASVPVGECLLGRVVSAIGEPIDGKDDLIPAATRPIEYRAPGIMERAAVTRPLHTGIKAIDAMVPIGKGQRELIVGDRQTGKTAIVLDTILNQKGKNIICIYVGIGQKESTIADLHEKLEEHGAADYTVIVSGSASDSAAMQYIAPFSATAMGEYFMYNGGDVLIIYDDLSKHAVAYRELSLLLQRPSGREAYPGDIFYLHSRLLERSAQLSAELGGGSITALPIIETQAGDIASYIPTNVISITDGQIFLESDLFHAGQRPAVNVGLSVSRVGGSAQTKLMKQVAADLRTKLAQYRELAEFTQFGAEVDEETKRTLVNGEHLTEALKQERFSLLEDWQQALLLYTVSAGYTDEVDVHRLREFEPFLFGAFETRCPALTEALKTGAKMSADTAAEVGEAVAAIVREF